MDFMKIEKDGDNCSCEVHGNPKELAQSILTCMYEDDVVAAIIIAAAEMYNNLKK